MDIVDKVLLAVMFIVGVIVGYGAGYLHQEKLMNQEFAKTKCGEYNKTTGVFSIVEFRE